MAVQFYLASRSPRRQALLEQLGLDFAVLAADVPEQPAPGQDARDYARRTALAKARAVAACAPLPLPVLGADTDVVLDGAILGKPAGRDAALDMLARLANRTHEVCSAVAVVAPGREELRLTVTRVTFGAVDPDEAAAYWDTGEPADKAGAYAIQGYAGRWVRSIEGSYSGVVGLPLHETVELLGAFGVQPRPGAAAQVRA